MDLLNMQAGTFYNVSAQHYGKFLPSPYPFLLWEPSDQPTLLNYTRHYLQGERHAEGFRFAINIDPVQFQVYTGNATGDAWNHRLDALSGRSGGQQAIVTYDDVHYLVVLSSKAVGGKGDEGYSMTVYAFDALLTNHSLRWVDALTLPTLRDIDLFAALSPSPPSQSSPVLVTIARSTDSITVSVYPIPSLASWQSLKPLLVHSIPLPSSSAVAAHDAVWHTADALFVVQLVATESPPAALLRVFMVNLTSGAVTLAANASTPTPALHSVTGVAVAAAAPPYAGGDSLCGPRAVPGALSYALSNYSVYAGYFCLRVDGAYLSPVVSMDLGSLPSLSIQRSPPPSSSPHFLLTLGTSYCWNTEPYNKQANSGLCDHTPLPMASTLTYSFGLLSSLIAYVQARAEGQEGSLICNDDFLHGTYDLGEKPRGKLWVGRDAEGVERLGVVEVHDGVSSMGHEGTAAEQSVGGVGLTPSNICGVAVPFDGIVVDAWPLPERTTWKRPTHTQKKSEELAEVETDMDGASETAHTLQLAQS